MKAYLLGKEFKILEINEFLLIERNKKTLSILQISRSIRKIHG